ncbi:alpha-glucosidase family protein [Xanthobacter autotrophicus]|uniref:alpha-glucosidase n=1 Tax=Xanthobacter TaxID=279 RepID=UPI0024AAB8EC|nr:alpha-glucosidase [Xanthobacter autotrophicus]MDI4663598.1 alpha-glucosidase family protein [Xanthobacter autotrophicus]
MTRAVASGAKAQSAAPDPEWWRGAVIYQIYPRSFQDTDGDGIGDLAGITSRLAYVADLGVDAIWLSPFFTSPMKDFGYDVSDYRGVDPVFGTLADFDALVAQAHRLGLKVIIDQVLSHTSDQHPWFAQSRADRTNAKADWYVWADPEPDGTPPSNWLAVFGGPAWEWDSRRRQYYLHNFLTSQPDLNLHNRAVQDALLGEVRFWLDRGVDGFRLDACNFYFHDLMLRSNPPFAGESEVSRANPYAFQDHVFDKNRPETLGFLQRVRALMALYPGTMTVGEIGESGARALALMAAYTSGGDKLHMCYSFDFLAEPFSAAHFRGIVERFEAAAADSWPCWAFSNHDVPRHVSRWRGGGREGTRLARLMAALLLSLRGSISLYEGEELGLPEADLAFADLVDPYGVRFWPDFKGRDGCRTPMVWEAGAPQGGFTTGRPWLPVPAAHLPLAVDRQSADPYSVLQHYRRLLRFRRAHPALGKGTITFLDSAGEVMAWRRDFEGEALLCAFNLGAEAAALNLPGGWAARPIEDLGFAGTIAGGRVSLGPLDAVFARLDPLG